MTFYRKGQGMGIKNVTEGGNIALTMAQRVGAGVLMAEQVDELEKAIRDDATLTKGEKILLCRTARANGQQNAELWEQIDRLNTDLEKNAMKLANAHARLDADDGAASNGSSTTGIWAVVILLSVLMVCVTSVIVAIVL